MNEVDFKRKVFSLSERIFPMVARMLGNEAEAEDALQEIMMKLWMKRKQIEQHPNPTGFAFLTARNYCLDLLKKKMPKMEESDFQLLLLDPGNGQEQLEYKELNALVRKILVKLPPNQREALIMRDIDGYEFAEIASILQLKTEHIRVLLSRARKQVCQELEKAYSYER